jgi:hypothetical protein
VKTEAAKVSHGARIPSFVTGEKRLRGVFDHQQPVLPGKPENGVHVAALAPIMNGQNGTRAGGDQIRQGIRIEREPNRFHRRVYRHTPRPQYRRGIGRICVRGKNDLVSRRQVHHGKRRLQCRRAGRRHPRVRRGHLGQQPVPALVGHAAVAARPAAGQHLFEQRQRLFKSVWFLKGYHDVRLPDADVIPSWKILSIEHRSSRGISVQTGYNRV